MLTPTPLTFDDKVNLRPGDRVRHRSPAGHEIDVTVRLRPVHGIDGNWIVGFAEVAGNYLLDDVTGILSVHHHTAGEEK